MSLSCLSPITDCPCGKEHTAAIGEVITGREAILKLPRALKTLGAGKVFVLADTNTHAAAGKRVLSLLEEAGIPYTSYVLPEETPEPDALCVGRALLHLDADCAVILSIGSGVLHDIGKLLSAHTGKRYAVVATAPSMDGYASATSSMVVDGLKVSLPTKCADIIIGDTLILKNAPLSMLQAGLGDMLAKYISLCEWRISHIVTGEYYCEKVADLVRGALRKCVDNADGLLGREDEAVEAVFEGLLIAGAAMAYAGLSRPASGVEHYFSHVWDMRALAFGTPSALHGTQCAVGTLYAARLYEKIKTMRPLCQKAALYAASFSLEEWKASLRAFLGKGAEAMILAEETDGKYDREKHGERYKKIEAAWPEILQIIEEEIPSSHVLENLLERLKMPKSLSDIGMEEDIFPMTFRFSKDIRDKYVLSRLAWDLGVLDELL